MSGEGNACGAQLLGLTLFKLDFSHPLDAYSLTLSPPPRTLLSAGCLLPSPEICAILEF